MRVVIVSRNDIEGGAGRAAYRIHRALIDNGVDSKMVVFRKASNDETVIRVPLLIRMRVYIARIFEKILLGFQKSQNQIVHSLNWLPTGMAKLINGLSPDVINLHWVNGSFVSIFDLRKMKTPIVWTQHDMWLVLGAEHYEGRIGESRRNAGYSSDSRPHGELGLDINRYAYLLKRRSLPTGGISVVTPSHWLSREIESSLSWSKGVTTIHNCCDSQKFVPMDSIEACRQLGLPLNKKIILFGAMNGQSDRRKGFHYLLESLALLSRTELKNELLCVSFGDIEGSGTISGIQHLSVGRKTDDLDLMALYGSATVLVAPSEQENLSNILVEGVMCGVPCVAFDVGGNSDIIKNGRDGYLVTPFDVGEMAIAMKNVLRSPWEKDAIRLGAIERFEPKKIATRYTNLFTELTNKE